MLDTLLKIDLQQFNRCPSDLRLAEECWGMPLEVLMPHISAGVEEGNEFVGHRIVRRQVAPLKLLQWAQAQHRLSAVVGPRCFCERM